MGSKGREERQRGKKSIRLSDPARQKVCLINKEAAGTAGQVQSTERCFAGNVLNTTWETAPISIPIGSPACAVLGEELGLITRHLGFLW